MRGRKYSASCMPFFISLMDLKRNGAREGEREQGVCLVVEEAGPVECSEVLDGGPPKA